MKKLSLALVLAMFAFGANAADTTNTNAAQKGQFKDGKAYEIVGNSVFLIDAKGNKQPAPDGSYTLSDGSTLQTKDGKKVDSTTGAAAAATGTKNDVKKASDLKAVGGKDAAGQAGANTGNQAGQQPAGSSEHKDASQK